MQTPSTPIQWIPILKNFCFLTLFYFILCFEELLNFQFYIDFVLKGKFIFILFAAVVDVWMRKQKSKRVKEEQIK